MRDARGGESFVARARALLGVEPRVISGDEEAALTFEGALVGLPIDGPVTVFDLGGGSTEVIRGEGRAVGRAVSLDVGSVRLTERHVRSDPPRPDELDAVRADVRRALREAGEGFGAPGSSVLVGVAGTVTTLAAFARGVAPYDPVRVHGVRLAAAEIARVAQELAGMPLAARRALAAIDPKRADVIVTGAVIVEEIVAWAGAGELVVSDGGVRWGLARRASRRSPG